MPKNLDRYFREMDRPAPPTGTVDRALARIAVMRRRADMLRHVPAIALGLALSAAGTIFAVQAAVADAVQSGLTGFLSMLVTDTGAVASSWQSYALAVADAVPAAPIAGACAALCAFFLLLRRLDVEIGPSRHALH